MKKLTAEKCREQFDECRALKERGYLSINGEYKLQALEIALPILEQQERGEGEWTEWGGGDQPITGYKLVDVRLRDGTEYQHQMGCLYWEHNGLAEDIIAYRIIPERATNQNGEQ